MKNDKLCSPLLNEESRIEELEFILVGVMHSVDKWLEGDEFTNDEVNRAAIAREKALQAIEARDSRIQELEEELQRVKYLSKFGK